jgi:hypothetical protein
MSFFIFMIPGIALLLFFLVVQHKRDVFESKFKDKP